MHTYLNGFAENEDFTTVTKNVSRADGSVMPQTKHDQGQGVPPGVIILVTPVQ